MSRATIRGMAIESDSHYQPSDAQEALKLLAHLRSNVPDTHLDADTWQRSPKDTRKVFVTQLREALEEWNRRRNTAPAP